MAERAIEIRSAFQNAIAAENRFNEYFSSRELAKSPSDESTSAANDSGREFQ
jgi:hypothetical protein